MPRTMTNSEAAVFIAEQVKKVLVQSANTCITPGTKSKFLRRAGDACLFGQARDRGEEAVKDALVKIIRDLSGKYSSAEVEDFLQKCDLGPPKPRTFKVELEVTLDQPPTDKTWAVAATNSLHGQHVGRLTIKSARLVGTTPIETGGRTAPCECPDPYQVHFNIPESQRHSAVCTCGHTYPHHSGGYHGSCRACGPAGTSGCEYFVAVNQ